MYERFFGLVDTPFRLTPDPRYLYLSRKHADALAHLKLVLTESSGFVCITGDVGTGKTTLLRAFLAELDEDVATAYVFNPSLTVLELLRTISAEFGLPPGSKSRMRLVEGLNRHLLAQREAGRRAVVVVDEAQAVSIEVLEELRLLSNLETATEKLLRIVLVGQPQLRALLLHPELVQLNQRITLRWHMGPLDRPETFAYVRHRLAVASEGEQRRVFTASALALVHRYSGGVPRLVNMIAHRAMLAAYAADRRVVGARAVIRAHRELDAVPLPTVRAPRRAAWAALAAGVCLGVIALGAGRIAWRRPAAAERTAAAETPATAPVVASAAPTAAPPDAVAAPPPTLVPPPSTPSAAEPAPPAAPDQAPPAAADAAAPPAADPAPPEAAEAAAPTDPDAVVRRLLAETSEASARAAAGAVLAAWHADPLGADESPLPADLPILARRRGLEHLPLVGNASMLRLLDLPAILELRLPDADAPRYAALTRMSVRPWLLATGDETMPIEPEFLDEHWFGRAHVLWRDFESLGPRILDQEASGPPVVRLQALLRRLGLYDGPETGAFDAPTTDAVVEFQRTRQLPADALVGPLTRIVLYGATGGYVRPSLGSEGGAS
jgi:general secretion pathway protein A